MTLISPYTQRSASHKHDQRIRLALDVLATGAFIAECTQTARVAVKAGRTHEAQAPLKAALAEIKRQLCALRGLPAALQSALKSDIQEIENQRRTVQGLLQMIQLKDRN